MKLYSIPVCAALAAVPFVVLGIQPAPVKAVSQPARPAVTRAGVPASAVSAERLEKLSRAYLGVPYKLDCLGEANGPDKDPLFTREYADCQTLVEQVMAEAIAPWVGGEDAAVRITRYYNRDVRIENRYHYCIPDWLTYPWPVKDITAQVAGEALKSSDRRIDRGPLLERAGGSAKASPIPVTTVDAAYIPRALVPGLQDRIPSGTIGIFVLDKPDIVSGHLGFLFRKDGTLMLRHASQTQKKVIEEPLTTYLQRAPSRFIGFKVLQPDVSGLNR